MCQKAGTGVLGQVFHGTMENCPRNNGISENRICIMCRIRNLFLRKFIYAVEPVCSIIKKKEKDKFPISDRFMFNSYTSK
jgi:hypothetical protein